MFYVLEFQSGSSGSAIPWCFDNRADAEEKYHDILRFAAKSSVPSHGAVIIRDDLFVEKKELYRHSTEGSNVPE